MALSYIEAFTAIPSIAQAGSEKGHLSPGGRDHRFLDLGDGIVTGLIDIEMRKVGNLVGRDDAIDDRGPLGCKSLGDRAAQLTGKLCLESVAAAGARQGGKIRVREFDRLPESWETHTFRLQNNESETRIIVDDHLHRQLVVHCRQELAHQHVEAAIAAKGDDLTRAVKRLDAV